jgi:hypothetical protein
MATPQRGGSPRTGTENTPYGKFCRLNSCKSEHNHEFGEDAIVNFFSKSSSY